MTGTGGGASGSRPGGTGTGGPLPGHLVALAASPAVRRWLEHAGEGGGPDDRTADLELLHRFCSAVEAGPDELVARCLRATGSGDTAISAAGRRRTDRDITAFVTTQGATGREGIALANRLRAFLIHNGIFLQGAAAID